MLKALAVEDDPNLAILYKTLLEDQNLEPTIAKTIQDARNHIAKHQFEIVLLDLELPGGSGLELLPEITEKENAPEVIIITGTGNTSAAETAFQYGAWDYVSKPFKISEITLPITRALEYRAEKKAQSNPKLLNRTQIVGESSKIELCLHEVGKASSTDIGVLITGETGTGKELFAQTIHQNSKRAEKPFIVVDCAALPENLIESTLFGHEKGAFTGADNKQKGLLLHADGGTLMLDEIGDLPLSAQKKFLRALQERSVRPIGSSKDHPFDIRVIAATNLDLSKMIEKGLFRKDLFYRIKALELHLPPLRERQGDVKIIALKMIYDLCEKYNVAVKALSTEFLDALENHTWPGNVRELINVLDYALASSSSDPTLYPKHLPSDLRISELHLPDNIAEQEIQLSPLQNRAHLPAWNDYRLEYEKEYLVELLKRVQGDKKKACDISGLSQSRLYGLINKHHL